MAWLDRRIDDMLSGYDTLAGLKIVEDPEAIFQEGWLLCDAGAPSRASTASSAPSTRATSPPTRSRTRARSTRCVTTARFTALVARAEAGRRRARPPSPRPEASACSDAPAARPDAVRTFARPVDHADILRRLSTLTPDRDAPAGDAWTSTRRSATWRTRSAWRPATCRVAASGRLHAAHGRQVGRALRAAALARRHPQQRRARPGGAAAPGPATSRPTWRRCATLAGGAVADCSRPPHPIFGPLSHAAWLRWAWLHTDHHLRQFGA